MKQMYQVKIGEVDIELPNLDTTTFDKLVKDMLLETIFGKEVVKEMRTDFQEAVSRGNFKLIEVDEGEQK